MKIKKCNTCENFSNKGITKVIDKEEDFICNECFNEKSKGKSITITGAEIIFE